MFYKSIQELPSNLKVELSETAQEVYRKTFNDNYPQNHKNVNFDSEELAHEAAWKAVREQFELKDGKWEMYSEK